MKSGSSLKGQSRALRETRASDQFAKACLERQKCHRFGFRSLIFEMTKRIIVNAIKMMNIARSAETVK